MQKSAPQGAYGLIRSVAAEQVSLNDKFIKRADLAVSKICYWLNLYLRLSRRKYIPDVKISALNLDKTKPT